MKPYKEITLQVYHGINSILTIVYNFKSNDLTKYTVDQLTLEIEKSITNLTNTIYTRINKEYTILCLSRKKFFKDDLYKSLIETIFFNKHTVLKLSPIFKITVES